MRHARSPLTRLVALASLLVLALLVAACEQGGPPAESRVATDIRVLASWQGPEIEAFRAVVAPFEERTGHRVIMNSTRDLKGSLQRSLTADDPPDLAGLPGPGYLLELARSGNLVDLGDVVDIGAYKSETAPGFVELGTVEGKLVGVFIKGTVKGLFWYQPDVFEPGAPASWAELQSAALRASGDVPPWCVGLASDASSGWPGTDWVEDFVLRQSGPRIYDDWVAGTLRWTSPHIRWAFQSFGTVLSEDDVAGGMEGALQTHFSRAGDGLLTDPPACLLTHQGSFMSTFLDEAVGQHGGRYDFIPFPDIDPRFGGALIGAGDLFALTRDTPGGRELLRYLISAEAQQLMVQGGGAISGNLTVQEYPDELTERQAQLLADADLFRFDASDSMPDVMHEAFWQAILDFATDPGQLDAILEHLDAVQAVAYSTG
jgi:alpha-glucoside transport system substrate-binding protein